MGRRSLAVLLMVAFLTLTTLRATHAQSPAQTADFLRRITTRIVVSNTATGQRELCHGFVQVVRGEVAFVATAKHCIEELVNGSLGAGVSLRDLGLSVRIEYSNGTTGAVRYVAWNRGQDVIVLVSSFEERPDSYSGLCPTCRIYRNFGSGQKIAVESILSAGGGVPVVSSGFVVSDQFGRYTVILPSSPGTSGSPVVDLQGNLVGIVVTGATFRGADAGWISGIVLGSAVTDVARYAFEHYPPTSAAPQPTAISPLPPAPPSPSQPTPAPAVPVPSSPPQPSIRFEVIVVGTARGFDVDRGVPRDEVTEFTPGETPYVFLKLRIPRVDAQSAGMVIPILIRWKGPSGDVIESRRRWVLKEGWTTVWTSVPFPLTGIATRKIGSWEVEFIVDGELMARTEFVILETPIAPVPSQPIPSVPQLPTPPEPTPPLISPSMGHPAWIPGDTWTYEARHGGSMVSMTMTILGINADTYLVRYQTPQKTWSESVPDFVSPTGEVQILNERTFWPLSVGKQLTAVIRSSGVEVSIVVEAVEEVTVPSGTFRSFRVVFHACARNECGTMRQWIAPEVKGVVKWEISDEPVWQDLRGVVMVLTSYGVNR